MKKVCICGGGNLGHVVTGFLAANGDCDVSLLTRHPERWQQQLEITTPDGEVMKGQVKTISSNPNDVISHADIVLLCLPGFSISEVLKQIAPVIKTSTVVGSIVSSTGFFFEAFKILPANTPLFGFQRVPFISRLKEYGHSADLLGYKPNLNIATSSPITPIQSMERLARGCGISYRESVLRRMDYRSIKLSYKDG